MIEGRHVLVAAEKKTFLLCHSLGWELQGEGWDGYLVALAVVGDLENTDTDAILERAMDGLVLMERQLSGSTSPQQNPSGNSHDGQMVRYFTLAAVAVQYQSS